MLKQAQCPVNTSHESMISKHVQQTVVTFLVYSFPHILDTFELDFSPVNISIKTFKWFGFLLNNSVDNS